MARRVNALAKMVASIKGDTRAERSPSDTLKQIIMTYLTSGRFDEYLYSNRVHVADYISDPHEVTGMRYRASKAGECPQRQAYDLVNVVLEPPPGMVKGERIIEDRPYTQWSALYNGTFTHLRWHMIFDALHADELVETLEAEVLGVNAELSLSGHIDRRIRFNFEAKPITAVIDFKSIKERYFLDLIKPEPAHVAQHTAYRLIGFIADKFMMLYENKNTHDLKIYDVEYDEVELAQLKRTFEQIDWWLEQVSTGVPPDKRFQLDLITKWCNWCPHLEQCGKDHPDLPQRRTKQAESNFEASRPTTKKDPVW